MCAEVGVGALIDEGVLVYGEKHKGSKLLCTLEQIERCTLAEI